VKAISIVGPSGSGKTGLICQLLAWFEARGRRVALLKHTHKRSLGDEGKDTGRDRLAGARLVALAAPGMVQLTRAVTGEAPLDELLATLAPEADLILVEGYKYGPLPKVALAGPNPEPHRPDYPHTIALVSREPVASELPVFQPGEITELGMFLEKYLGLV
jgi:molybdopterin-guanine dinucleotide biosynthesis protein MobB